MSRSVSLSEPATEPLSLSEAKKHLTIADAYATHDTHVNSLIVAARELWEHDTQSVTVQRTITENLSDWPTSDWRFYYRPVTAVSSVTYYDAGNDSQTLASSVYSLDAPNRRLVLAVDQEWPSIETRWDAIAIAYTAGPAIIPEIAKQAMKLQLSMMFGDDMAAKEYGNWQSAYHNLVARYQRSSYP